MIKVKVTRNGSLPTRAHRTDAGLDLYAAEDIVIDNYGPVETFCAVQIPEGFGGFVKSRSSLMKKGVLVDGTIDCGYTGSIKVMVFNFNVKPLHICTGDRIAQLVLVPCNLDECEQVDRLDDTERGSGGFGSTGR